MEDISNIFLSMYKSEMGVYRSAGVGWYNVGCLFDLYTFLTLYIEIIYVLTIIEK